MLAYLRDTLLVLSSEQNSPGDPAGVLALEEEGFGLSILEAEDLRVATDVELALCIIPSAFQSATIPALKSQCAVSCSFAPHRHRAALGLRTFPG